MTGRQLIKWIEENKAEDHEVIVADPDNRYLEVVGLWEGEEGNGTIMISTEERR